MMPAPTAYLTSFEVTGRGQFPLDMLRRDRCFPVDGDSAALIHADCSGRRTIKMEAAWPHRWWSPTVARWASFGWTVVVPS